MSDDFSKLWLQQRLNQNAITRASEAIQRTGRALPCKVTAISGSIVTVEFEVNAAPWTLPPVTIPKAESTWLRIPTQVGDTGMTLPADVYLGGVSGLGGGTATMSPVANLSALVFVPISMKSSPPTDQNAAQISGPNGVILETTTGTTSSMVLDTSGIVLTFGTTTVTINASGVAIDGTLITLVGGGGTPLGIVQGNCVCAFTGQPHAMISGTVEGTL